MSKPVTKSHAKRNTLLAQGGALLLAGTAVGIALLGVPLLSSPGARFPTVDEVMATREAERRSLELAVPVEDEAQPMRAVDLTAVAERLGVLVDLPAEVAQAEGEDAGETPAPVVSNSELKFLGSIREPTRELALVSLNGMQRIVPVGGSTTFSTPEGMKITVNVLSLDGGELTIERDGVREQLAKAARVSQTVTMVQTVGERPGASGASPETGRPPGEESEIDRRRREADERRQRILERQRETEGSRWRPEGQGGGPVRPDREGPQK
ncbi:MAG: hypothetical protein DYG94_01585 [Leptolyngbya sp. PLA3]|nr:MAG: hypothetical protein EDM82_00300 [Cyanobacteria bacterium CYA]MCE7967423.1 hypothetical protein [Leptolyngbya sp. PL-A3]